MASDYDVFISYNSADAGEVTRFAEALQARRVRVWLDKFCLPKGQDWRPQAERALQECAIIIVCVGRHGVGPWQDKEISTAIQLQVEQPERRVIPVLLEGVTREKVPLLLQTHTWFAFAPGLSAQSLDEFAAPLPKSLPPASNDAPVAVESEKKRHLHDAVVKLANFLLQGQHATFFLGSWTDDLAAPLGAKSSYLARELLREAELIDQNYSHLLPPVDVAGLYYAVRSEGNWNGGWELEFRVNELLAQCTNEAIPTQQALAHLLKTLQTNLRPRRVPNPDPQLLVTTNLDVQMERALLIAGIAFTRVVQHQSAKEITINEYAPVRLDERDAVVCFGEGNDVPRVPLRQISELDDQIASYGKHTIELQTTDGTGKNILTSSVTGQQQRTKLILYKLLGSQDVPYSCTISAGQHFEFAQNALRNNCIPLEITKLLGNTPAIFLGYGFLDPDLRLLYHVMLQKQFALKTHVAGMRYALRLPPSHEADDHYRRVEARIWDGIKRVVNHQLGVTLLEERGDVFLRQLTEQIKARL